MKFCSKKPTKPGYYYCRRGKFTTIVELVEWPNKKEMELLMFGTEHKFPISIVHDSVEFAGPIEIPEGDNNGG